MIGICDGWDRYQGFHIFFVFFCFPFGGAFSVAFEEFECFYIVVVDQDQVDGCGSFLWEDLGRTLFYFFCHLFSKYHFIWLLFLLVTFFPPTGVFSSWYIWFRPTTEGGIPSLWLWYGNL